MNILRGYPPRRPKTSKRLAATIGVFDGVHRGHLAILRATRAQARAIRGSAVVITFDRHPLKTLAPRAAPRCLMTLKQRLDEFQALHFSHTIVLPFQPRLAALSAETFVQRILVGRLRLAALTVGYDFHFGREGTGDAALLKRLGGRFGFHVTVVPPVLDRREPISSTRIRRLISLGDVTEAARLLSRPPYIVGACRRGLRLGRTLGFPTINIQPANELLPRYGVYVVRIGKERRPGAANLGVRPTIQRGSRAALSERKRVDGPAVTPPKATSPLLEVHCLGRPPRIIPGQAVRVELLRFLRPERNFSNLNDSRAQIARDVIAARRHFRGHT